MKRRISLGLAWLVVHVHAPAQIQTAQAPQQVVVSGSQTEVEASRDFVAGKLIIGRQRIDDSGVQNAGELLGREPAVSVGKDGRIGLLGLDGYTQILVDGTPYTGDPMAIDLVQIDHIEIIKSATAVTGPVGIAGTINIVRRRAQRKALQQVRIGATTAAGRPGADIAWSNNQVVADSPFSYNWRLSAQDRPTSVASHYAETSMGADGAAAPVFKGARLAPSTFRSLLASGELAWAPNADHKLSLMPELARFSLPSQAIEQRDWTDGRSLAVRERTDSTLPSYSAPLRWEWHIDADSNLSLKWTRSHLRTDADTTRFETGSAATAQQRRDRQDSRHTNDFLDLDVTTSIAGGHAISVGAKLARNRIDTAYTDLVDGVQDPSLAVFGTDSSAQLERVQLFAQDEWRINRGLALNVGLSAEHRDYTFDEGPAHHQAQFDMWSPSLHLSQKIGGDSKRQIRFSLARSFRPPEIDQMLLHPTINTFAPCPVNGLCGANTIDTADSSGNPALLPERALGVNLSYTHGLGKSSELVAEVYTRDIQNKTGSELVLDNVAWAAAPRYVLRPANLGAATIRGLNLEGRLAGKDLWNLAAVELHGSLGFAHATLSDIPGPDNRIAEQTPWRAKLGGSYNAPTLPLKLGVEAGYLPADWVRDSLNERIYQSNKATLNLNGRWKLNAKSSVVLTLDNLLHHATTRIDEYLGAAAVLRQTTVNDNYARFTLRFETTL